MKTKCQMHAEAVEILNKPGRFLVIRQYTCGGPLFTDNNKGDGYDLDTATKTVSDFNNCRMMPKNLQHLIE